MKIARGLSLGLALALATLPRSARADDATESIQSLPCRPTIACTADLVVPGAFELEAGVLYRKLAGGVKQVTDPFLAKLTVAKWLQLQVGSNGYTANWGAQSLTYFDNVSFAAKFHHVDQSKWVPSVSTSFAISVPGAGQGAAAYDDIQLTGYVTKDLGPIHADLNVGYNRFAINAYPVGQGWVALALSTNLPRGFGFMVEEYYFSDAGVVASRDAGSLVAFSYSPARWVVFDAGGDIGYVSETRDYSLFAGLTIAPFRLWKDD